MHFSQASDHYLIRHNQRLQNFSDQGLPTWDNDALSPYERQELDAIYQDLYAGVDEDQLRDDWQRLEVLDKALKARLVL